MPEQVDFYVLNSSDVTSKLMYVCRVVSKAYKQGLNVYIQFEESAQVELFDQLLWSFNPASFVPHAVIDESSPGGETSVLMGTCPAPVGWDQLLVSLTREIAQDVARYTRIADFVGGDEQDRQSGRDRFRAYRQLGIVPKTHHLDS